MKGIMWAHLSPVAGQRAPRPPTYLGQHAGLLIRGWGLGWRDGDGQVGGLPALQAAARHRGDAPAILVSGGHGGRGQGSWNGEGTGVLRFGRTGGDMGTQVPGPGSPE